MIKQLGLSLLAILSLAACESPMFAKNRMSDTEQAAHDVRAQCHNEAEAWRVRMADSYQNASTNPYPDSNHGATALLYHQADRVYEQCIQAHGVADAQ